jgi:CHASE2 domain-containing sensor protein
MAIAIRVVAQRRDTRAHPERMGYERATISLKNGAVRTPDLLSQRRSLLAAVLTALLGLGAAGLAVAAHLTDRAEQQTLDWRWHARGDRQEDPRLAIVAIDDASLHRRHATWPPSRRLHAEALSALAGLGVDGVVYGPEFDLAGRSKAADDTLLDAISHTPNVVLTATLADADGPRFLGGGGFNRRASGAAFGGDIEVRDDDDALRRFAVDDAPLGLRAVPVVAAETVLGHRVRPPGGRPWIDLPDAPCELNGPAAADGRLPCPVPAYTLDALLDRRVPSDALEGRTVVVGYTGSDQQILRRSWTGGGHLVASAQLTVHEIGTVLRGFPLRDAAWWVTALATLLLCGVPAAVALLIARRVDARVEEPSWTLSTARVVAAGLLGVAAWCALAVVLFHEGRVVAVAAPVSGALVATAVAATRTGALVRTRSADIWRTATGLAPEQMLDRVVRETAGRRLVAGDNVAMTILFADVRDSSTYVNALDDPAEVWAFSQAFMRRAVAVVEEHGGYAQSLEGDGLLAMFAHADGTAGPAADAVDAAVELIDSALDGIRADVARDLPRLAQLTARRPIGLRVAVQSGLVHLGVSGGDGRTRARWATSTVGRPTHQAAKLREAATFDRRSQWGTMGAEIFPTPASDQRIAVIAQDTMTLAREAGTIVGLTESFRAATVTIEGASPMRVWVCQRPGDPEPESTAETGVTRDLPIVGDPRTAPR